MQEVRKCAICGNEFIAKRANTIYCSGPCRIEANRRRNKANWQKHIEEKNLSREIKRRGKPKAPMTLAEIEAAARAEGIHYGEYVEKYGL